MHGLVRELCRERSVLPELGEGALSLKSRAARVTVTGSVTYSAIVTISVTRKVPATGAGTFVTGIVCGLPRDTAIITLPLSRPHLKHTIVTRET